MAIPATAPALHRLVYGGAVLGCGGGGSIDSGLAVVREALALGAPRIAPLASLQRTAIVATVSAVGSVGKTSDRSLDCSHFTRALQLFEAFSGSEVEGLITSEVGPRSVTYGLRESAARAIPVIDAPANGRAHPLYTMGALGLHRKPRIAVAMVAVGGTRGTASYIELAARTNVVKAARIVRDRASQGSMALAVVRNPVTATVVRRHAAVGALSFAYRLGGALLAALPQGPTSVLHRVADLMQGTVYALGRVASVALAEEQGFSVGSIEIRRASGPLLRILVCNEFMAVSDGDRLVAAFPDLIALFDRVSGLPLATGEVRVEAPVALFTVPRHRLRLGSTMSDSRLLRPIEQLLGIRFARRPRCARVERG